MLQRYGRPYRGVACYDPCEAKKRLNLPDFSSFSEKTGNAGSASTACGAPAFWLTNGISAFHTTSALSGLTTRDFPSSSLITRLPSFVFFAAAIAVTFTNAFPICINGCSIAFSIPGTGQRVVWTARSGAIGLRKEPLTRSEPVGSYETKPGLPASLAGCVRLAPGRRGGPRSA